MIRSRLFRPLRLAALGAIVSPSTPAEFAAFLADDQKCWTTHMLLRDEQWREHDRLNEKQLERTEALEEQMLEVNDAVQHLLLADSNGPLSLRPLRIDVAAQHHPDAGHVAHAVLHAPVGRHALVPPDEQVDVGVDAPGLQPADEVMEPVKLGGIEIGAAG